MDGVKEVKAPETPVRRGDGSRTSHHSNTSTICPNKSQRGLSPLENQLASLSDGIAERLQKMEGNINLNDIRIEKLEEQMDHMPTQLLQMQFTPRSTVTEVMKTMVVGGLQSLQTLDAATQWSNAKLKTLTGPCQQGTYIKSQQFQACCLPSSLLHWSVTLQWRCYVLFFFPSTLLLHEPGPVDVVTADSVYAGLSPGVLTMFILACSEVGEIHVALSFPFVEVASSRGWVSSCPTGGGRLRWLIPGKCFWSVGCRNWPKSGFMKHELSIDENFRSVLVGGQKVINMATENGNVVYTWSPQWDAWNDIQHSEELQLLKDRASGRGVVERKKMIRRRELQKQKQLSWSKGL